MNWKINYWTLLFAVALIASIYLKMNAPLSQKQIQPDEPCTGLDTCASLMLPPDVGNVGVHQFDTSGLIFRMTKNNGLKIRNLDVDGFMLHACELRQIINFKKTGTHVFANLALFPVSNDSLEIRLFFKSKNDNNQEGYFDFSRPCPTCPDQFVIN